MSQQHTVERQYTIDAFQSRVEEILAQAGFGPGPIEWSQMALLDQFHVRGLEATKELGASLQLDGSESILDVGSGLGGPARYLAATYGCHVTGIDLSESFTGIATLLGERAGLSDRLTFVQGNALNLPFAANQFDHAWTQHVAMNIEDKERLYKGIFRVLKPGGKLAIYDVVKGSEEPVVYPTPWAREAAISFLATPAAMEQALAAAGFAPLSSVDTTPQALQWFAAMQSAAPSPDGPPPLSLATILGEDIRPAIRNLGQNVREGRVALRQIVVQKPN